MTFTDPHAEFGCAVAASINGPYVKLTKAIPVPNDSRVLV
jgi:hypothetical protein